MSASIFKIQQLVFERKLNYNWTEKAVFGGRINDRRQKDLKVNPVFTDHSRSNSESGTDDYKSEFRDAQTSVKVVIYETFPRYTRGANNDTLQKVDISTDNENKLDVIGHLEGGLENVQDVETGCESGATVTDDGQISINNSGDTSKSVEGETDDKLVEENVSTKENAQQDPSDKHVIALSDISSGQLVIEAPCDGEKFEFSSESKVVTNNSSRDELATNEESKEIECKGISSITADKTDTRSRLLAEIIEKAKMKMTIPEKHAISNVAESIAVNTKNNGVNNIIPKAKSSNFQLLGFINNGFIADEQENSDMVVLSGADTNVCDKHDVVTDTDSPTHSVVIQCEPGTESVTYQPQSTVVAEVSVHVGAQESKRNTKQDDDKDNPASESKENPTADPTDNWPDINDLVRSDVGFVDEHTTIDIEPEGMTTIVHDNVLFHERELLESNHQRELPKSSDLDKLDNGETVNDESHSYQGFVTDGTSSTRTLKSILSNGSASLLESSDTASSHPENHVAITEAKTVKFSEDTVFIENKTKKYRVEAVDKINLREFYRGKISSDNAIAKVNPLFSDDEEDRVSLTDDEKLAYQSAMKDATAQGSIGRLNKHAYMEHYLILKAHGLKPSRPFDISQLPEEMNIPTYERLIRRTLAKERRKLAIKWTLVILTVAFITAISTTVGVYYTLGF